MDFSFVFFVVNLIFVRINFLEILFWISSSEEALI